MTSNQPFTDEQLLLAEALVKLAAIERLLMRAGVFTEDQLIEEVKAISTQIVETIKSQVKKEN